MTTMTTTTLTSPPFSLFRALTGLIFLLQIQCGASQLRGTASSSSSLRHHDEERGHCPDTLPGQFDFFVLSMSFQPEFCYQHRYEEWAGCENPNDLWRGSLTIHGLWPQFDDGKWPCECSDEEFNPQTLADLGEDKFNIHWPNVKAAKGKPGYTGFWEHEWHKHGSCTGLSQDEYFQSALNHFLLTPDTVGRHYGSSVSKSEITGAYSNNSGVGGDDENDVVLICVDNTYLSEVRVCVDRNKDGTGSRRIPCPASVISEGNCGDTIRITKFYIDADVMAV
jgi:ribonuclease T2